MVYTLLVFSTIETIFKIYKTITDEQQPIPAADSDIEWSSDSELPEAPMSWATVSSLGSMSDFSDLSEDSGFSSQ